MKCTSRFCALFVLFFLAACAGGPVISPPNQTTVDCQTITSPLPPPWLGASAMGTGQWSYCIEKGIAPWTLYYNFGYSNDVHAWQKMGGLSAGYFATLQKLKAMWKDQPTVVVIAYTTEVSGLSLPTPQLLSPLPYRSQPPQLARVDHYVNVAMPMIESKYNLKGPRILVGMSQSGFTAAELVLTHPELWAGVVIQHAVNYTTDPWNLFQMCLPCFMAETSFWKSDWSKIDPMQLALKVDISKLPPILISGANNDNFKLFDPDMAFYTRLKLRGANVGDFVTDIGDHNSFDPLPINNFIQKVLAK